MKKFITASVFLLFSVIAFSQVNKTVVLEDLEKDKAADLSITATLKSASRLFESREDLTSVILVIPKGSKVTITGSDSTYYKVIFDQDEGYIFKKDVVIDTAPPSPATSPKTIQAYQQSQTAEKQVSRLDYLENKYGPSLAAKLYERKIWKGMTAQMVRDSWGTPLKINRDIGETQVREEWIYKSAWLYLENNTLVDWGPAK
jgi:hypothetical protein